MGLTREQPRMKPGAGGARASQNFENDGVTSQAVLKCLVLYCFTNNCPTPIKLLSPKD